VNRAMTLEKLLMYCGPESTKELKKITGWNIKILHGVIEWCLIKNTIYKKNGEYYFGSFLLPANSNAMAKRFEFPKRKLRKKYCGLVKK
jgi:hypothetical protein